MDIENGKGSADAKSGFLPDRLHNIESDGEGLEPQEFGAVSGTLDLDNPGELEYWSGQFQISPEELKAAVLMRRNSISEVKKYLSE